jgi:hypothetical protein
MKTKTYANYDGSEDIIILGQYAEKGDIELTDDYTSCQVNVGDTNVMSIETDGFISILSPEEYEEWVEECITNEIELDDLDVDAIYLPKFKGDISMAVESDRNGGTSTNFDFDDFIGHQIEEVWEFILQLPEGTKVYPIENHDLFTLRKKIRK